MPVDVGLAENLSNLTWLAFAGASLLLWRRKVLPALGGRWRRSLFALGGVLLLMFPVISLSDDLHPDLVIAAEGDGKLKLLPKTADHSSACRAPAVVATAEGRAPNYSSPVLVVLTRLSALEQVCPLDGTAPTRSVRAPPHALPA